MLSNEPTEVTLVSANVCFLEKRQLRKVSWRRIVCMRNRWWLSPGVYLQESLCSAH